MNFQTFFDAQSDFGKNFVTKNLLTWTILILSNKYALKFLEFISKPPIYLPNNWITNVDF